MDRRTFWSTAFVAVCSTISAVGAENKTFVFKIRTKGGSIISNIAIPAKDIFAAQTKLEKRYPGCKILEGRER